MKAIWALSLMLLLAGCSTTTEPTTHETPEEPDPVQTWDPIQIDDTVELDQLQINETWTFVVPPRANASIQATLDGDPTISPDYCFKVTSPTARTTPSDCGPTAAGPRSQAGMGPTMLADSTLDAGAYNVTFRQNAPGLGTFRLQVDIH